MMQCYGNITWPSIMNGKYLIGGKSTLKVMVTKDATNILKVYWK